MSATVWRHVDKTGPEGNIEAFLQHGQGDFCHCSWICEVFTSSTENWLVNKLIIFFTRCCAGGRQRASAALLGRNFWWIELGDCAWFWQVITSLIDIGAVYYCSYFDQVITAFVLYFSFQSACLVGQQDIVKHVAVLKKTAISLHYLSNGHQKWIENLPDRWIIMFISHFVNIESHVFVHTYWSVCIREIKYFVCGCCTTFITRC